LLSGFFARFRQFSGALQRALGRAHLLFRGVGARGGRRCFSAQPLRRSSAIGLRT
jgi:hypothetical protein